MVKRRKGCQFPHIYIETKEQSSDSIEELSPEVLAMIQVQVVCHALMWSIYNPRERILSAQHAGKPVKHLNGPPPMPGSSGSSSVSVPEGSCKARGNADQGSSRRTSNDSLPGIRILYTQAMLVQP